MPFDRMETEEIFMNNLKQSLKHSLMKVLLPLGIAAAFTACQNPSDPNLQWLLTVLNGTTSATAPETINFDVTIGDEKGDPTFLFDNTTTLPVHITIVDPYSAVTGSLVQILDGTGTGSRVIFRAVTDTAGNVTGAFTIENRANPSVTIQFTYAGKEYQFLVDLTGVTAINRYIFVDGTVTQQPVVHDRDGDGIADEIDNYPDDATRATKISIPADSYFTIAYEDLYPVPGDADFNDFVVRVRTEEDLNAAGQVVRLRSEFTHVAKGAGYNHFLRMQLPASGTYTLKRTAADGTIALNATETLTAGTPFDIFPASNTTIAQSNTATGQTFVLGMKAELEAIFTTPVSTTSIPFPFDVYLHVINTNRDVHFAGRALAADGSDPYIDSNGFPWALLIPGDWAWPLEKKNIHNAYPQFQTWYSSGGKDATSWYLTSDANYVFLK